MKILVIIILLIILFLIFYKKNNYESYSNIKYNNGYFIFSKENQELYQDYISESNNLQAPMLMYNICTKGYNHMT